MNDLRPQALCSKFYVNIYNMLAQILTTRGFVPLAFFFLTLLDVDAYTLKKTVETSLDNEVCKRNIARHLVIGGMFMRRSVL